MSTWKAQAGETVLIPSGNSSDHLHLFVIVTNPKRILDGGLRDHVLLVPFCTVYNDLYKDTACILDAGEHPFINHESYVDYAFARTYPVFELEHNIRNGFFQAHRPVSNAVLVKIQNGLQTTKRIKKYIKNDFIDHTWNSLSSIATA